MGNAAAFPQTVGNWISTIFLIRLDNFELPITPSWTLIHEVAFYLIFAFFILNRIIGSIIFSTWMLACILVFQYAPEGSRSALTTYFSPLNLNFLIGIGAYYLWEKAPIKFVKPIFPLGAILFCLLLILEKKALTYEQLQLGYVLSFGLLIASAAAWESGGFPAERFRLLSIIGNASYTIYLTHLAFFGLYAKILIKISSNLPMNSYSIYLIVFMATVVSGCFVYQFVERPLLRICRKYLFTQPEHSRPSLQTSER